MAVGCSDASALLGKLRTTKKVNVNIKIDFLKDMSQLLLKNYADLVGFALANMCTVLMLCHRNYFDSRFDNLDQWWLDPESMLQWARIRAQGLTLHQERIHLEYCTKVVQYLLDKSEKLYCKDQTEKFFAELLESQKQRQLAS